MPTITQSLASATRILADAGITSPDWDAERLLRHVLDWDRATLFSHLHTAVASEHLTRFEAIVAQRARRQPLQHLVGTQDFWRHSFLVTPDVLIPRPETEILVEAALRLLRGVADPVVVDVGTGSGCIALSLAAEIPEARVHAIDISPAALAVAAANAQRLGLTERVTFHLGDLLAPVEGIGRVDLVASNPPYVDAAEVPQLEPEVRDHEPQTALVPPDGNGYAIYQRLVDQAARRLPSPAALVLELGAGMAAEVSRLCLVAGLAPDPPLADLQGHARVLISRPSPRFGADPAAR